LGTPVAWRPGTVFFISAIAGAMTRKMMPSSRKLSINANMVASRTNMP